MFTIGTCNTFFTELATVRGQVPHCGRCQKSLSKKLARENLHPLGFISFWFIRCPDCRQGHVIFNDPAVLPPLPPDPPQESRSTLAGKTDPNQANLPV